MSVTSRERMDMFERFAKPFVDTGRYKSVDEVLDAAMDALLEDERGIEQKFAFLRQAIEDGDASGVAEGDVIARVRERAGLPPRQLLGCQPSTMHLGPKMTCST